MFLLWPHRYLSDFFFRCNIVPLKTTWEQEVIFPINHCWHHHVLLYYINKSLFLSSLLYLWWKFSFLTILFCFLSPPLCYPSTYMYVLHLVSVNLRSLKQIIWNSYKGWGTLKEITKLVFGINTLRSGVIPPWFSWKLRIAQVSFQWPQLTVSRSFQLYFTMYGILQQSIILLLCILEFLSNVPF